MFEESGVKTRGLVYIKKKDFGTTGAQCAYVGKSVPRNNNVLRCRQSDFPQVCRIRRGAVIKVHSVRQILSRPRPNVPHICAQRGRLRWRTIKTVTRCKAGYNLGAQSHVVLIPKPAHPIVLIPCIRLGQHECFQCLIAPNADGWSLHFIGAAMHHTLRAK